MPLQGPLRPSGVPALQRSAGNKATANLINQMRSSDPPVSDSSPSLSGQAGDLASADDERAEAETDRVASAATRRWESSGQTPNSEPSPRSGAGSPERLVANAVAPELSLRPGAAAR
jgi:hypothetical protein